MSTVTFDGINAGEVAAYAAGRYEGTVLLVRNDDGQLTLVWPGYVLERRDDGGLGIYSDSAWRRNGEAAA